VWTNFLELQTDKNCRRVIQGKYVKKATTVLCRFRVVRELSYAVFASVL
jgi:hypothetical protein